MSASPLSSIAFARLDAQTIREQTLGSWAILKVFAIENTLLASDARGCAWAIPLSLAIPPSLPDMALEMFAPKLFAASLASQVALRFGRTPAHPRTSRDQPKMHSDLPGYSLVHDGFPVHCATVETFTFGNSFEELIDWIDSGLRENFKGLPPATGISLAGSIGGPNDFPNEQAFLEAQRSIIDTAKAFLEAQAIAEQCALPGDEDAGSDHRL